MTDTIRWGQLSPRERDVVVAEHVMGETFVYVRGKECAWQGNQCIRWEPDDFVEVDANGEPVEYPTLTPAFGPYNHCPNYTSDIAAAMEVAGKMMELPDKFLFTLSWETSESGEVEFAAGDSGCPYREPPQTLPGGRYNPETGHGFSGAIVDWKDGERKTCTLEGAISLSVVPSLPEAVALAALRAGGLEVED